MPVRDMGYQHAKYMEQIKEAKESNRKTGNYPTPMTKELNDSQQLSPVITLVLNYSQKEWKKPRCLNDMLEFPEDIGEELTKWIPEHPICIINLASQKRQSASINQILNTQSVICLVEMTERNWMDIFKQQNLNQTIRRRFQTGCLR